MKVLFNTNKVSFGNTQNEEKFWFQLDRNNWVRLGTDFMKPPQTQTPEQLEQDTVVLSQRFSNAIELRPNNEEPFTRSTPLTEILNSAGALMRNQNKLQRFGDALLTYIKAKEEIEEQSRDHLDQLDGLLSGFIHRNQWGDKGLNAIENRWENAKNLNEKLKLAKILADTYLSTRGKKEQASKEKAVLIYTKTLQAFNQKFPDDAEPQKAFLASQIKIITKKFFNNEAEVSSLKSAIGAKDVTGDLTATYEEALSSEK